MSEWIEVGFLAFATVCWIAGVVVMVRAYRSLSPNPKDRT